MTCMCLKTWPFQTPMEDANQSRSSNTHKSGSTRKTQLIRQVEANVLLQENGYYTHAK